MLKIPLLAQMFVLCALLVGAPLARPSRSYVGRPAAPQSGAPCFCQCDCTHTSCQYCTFTDCLECGGRCKAAMKPPCPATPQYDPDDECGGDPGCLDGVKKAAPPIRTRLVRRT
jgi:hypothetical protein